MNILLHTIALEPARWTLRRVSQKLTDLIPKIAEAGFNEIEIFEPHLTLNTGEESIPKLLADHGLAPVILSSYLLIAPHMTNDEKFASEKSDLVARVRRFGFRKVRLFPGGGVSPTDKGAVAVVADRIAQIARELPDVEILLETHDGSIADDPEAVVALVEQTGRKNVGLLWQPTVMTAEAALEQFATQKHLIRHIHLQNRGIEPGFDTLKHGVVPWEKILSQVKVDATLEFVPCAICPLEQFDLAQSLVEAVSEAAYARSIA